MRPRGPSRATKGADVVQPGVRSAVVDCALYVGGVRQPEPMPFHVLYEKAKELPDAFVWIGLHEPDPLVFAEIEEVFGLHPLAVEDTLKPTQRPKVERYGDVTFLVVRTARYLPHSPADEASEVIDTGSVRLFIGSRFVVTVRHGEAAELRAARTDLEANPARLAGGPWSVVHAILDQVVDGYLDIVAAIDDDVEALESAVFRRESGVGIERVYQLKREVMSSGRRPYRCSGRCWPCWTRTRSTCPGRSAATSATSTTT